MQICQCQNNFIMDFSGTFVVPASFEIYDPTQFSIAVSTDNLSVYNQVIDYPVRPIVGPCGDMIDDLSEPLGLITVSGAIMYRIAANGLQSDPLIIPPQLQGRVNNYGSLWSSVDGFVDICDGGNNFAVIGVVDPDQQIDPQQLTVTLRSLVLGSVVTEKCSCNQIVTLKGQFEIGYGLFNYYYY